MKFVGGRSQHFISLQNVKYFLNVQLVKIFSSFLGMNRKTAGWYGDGRNKNGRTRIKWWLQGISIWSFIFFAIQAFLSSLSKHDNISLTLFHVYSVSLLIIILIKPKCEE